MTQIVVMKALEGFADRLQVLSHLMYYCLVNKAMLCIDWRDENWGQGRWDFSDFFEIIGIPVIPLEKINMKDAKIVPSCWSHEFIKNPISTIQMREEFVCPIMRDSFEKIEGDILVTNGRGHRIFFTENIIGNLRIKPQVAELIQRKLQHFYLPATVVHLRGTDRYDPELINTWFKEYDTLLPHSKARVYHISDSKDLMSEWVKKVPHSELCVKDSHILKIPNVTKKGTHHLSKEALEFYSITKYDLNIDVLADFMALAFATDAVGNEKSVFFEMARHISRFGPELTGDILRGYRPPRKSLLPIINKTVFYMN